MVRKLKWAGPKHKTPRMEIIMAIAAWDKKNKNKKEAQMQCKSAEATREELAEALAEGQGSYSLGHGEGYWFASPVKQRSTALLS